MKHKIDAKTIELADSMTADEIKNTKRKIQDIAVAHTEIHRTAIKAGISEKEIEDAPSWKLVVEMIERKGKKK